MLWVIADQKLSIHHNFCTIFHDPFTFNLTPDGHHTLRARKFNIQCLNSDGTFRGLTCAVCFCIAISCLLIPHVNLSLNHAAKIIEWRTRRRGCVPLKAVRSLNAKNPANRWSWFAYMSVEPTWSTKREVKWFLINVRLTLSPLYRKTHEMTSMTVSAWDWRHRGDIEAKLEPFKCEPAT